MTPRRAAFIAFIVVAAAALMAFVAARSAPTWWHPSSARDATSSELAAAFENGLLEIATRVSSDVHVDGTATTSDREWAVRIDEAQINAWLATRLIAWLDHMGVAMRPTVQIDVETDQLRIGLRAADGGAVHVLKARLEAVDGALRLRPTGGGVGRLPLPFAAFAPAVAASLGDALSDRLGDTGASRIDRDGLTCDPVSLGDGREVEFIDVELRRGEIRLRARTVRITEVHGRSSQ